MPIAQPFLHVATDADGLRPLDAARLMREPPAREWMVEGCFARGTVGMLSGDGGIGKSLIAQQLCTCAALGRPWLDLHVTPGRALFFGCEDDGDELHRRQWNINRHLGVDMGDVLDAGLDLVSRVAQENTLMTLDRRAWRMARTGLMDKLVVLCRERGIQYLVLDTATKVFGGNQNDEKQVADFISELHRLAIMMQGVVLLTKHPSASGRALGTGESGSVQWENSVRSRLYLRDVKNVGLELRGMKQNYSRKMEPMPIEWRRGVFVRPDRPLPRDFSEPAYS